MQDTNMTVTQTVLDSITGKVATFWGIVGHQNMIEWGPKSNLHDDYGWSSSGCPVVMWEEGPYQWAYEVSDNPSMIDGLVEILKANNLSVGAATSWCLSVYPS